MSSSASTARGAAVSLTALVLACTLVGCVGPARDAVQPADPGATAAAPSTPMDAPPPAAESPSPSPSAPVTPPASLPPAAQPPSDPPPSASWRLQRTKRILGQLDPKSVVASGNGLFFAQNMMYLHTIAVYDRDYELVATIKDTVDLGAFKVPGHTGVVKGGPVEAAFTPGGRQAYVSNYSMFGPGFAHPGDDTCSPKQGIDPSFVYRIDAPTLAIDQVIEVGSVPKYLAVSPDGRLLLVSNWCSYDMSVIDTRTGTELRRIPLGAYPRGIAITADSRTAYVAVMGSTDVAVVDLATYDVSMLRGIGRGPRHLVLDPEGRYLYATLNGEDRIAKIDLATGTVVGRVATGNAPRSMAMSPDGGAVYVVNYASDTVSKVRTSDLAVLQTLPTDHHPIGITVDVDDSGAQHVWVACYAGSLIVFSDS